MKFHIVQLDPTPDMNHPFFQCLQAPRSHLGYQISWPGAVVLEFWSPLFDLIMAPKRKSSDAGNSEAVQC